MEVTAGGKEGGREGARCPSRKMCMGGHGSERPGVTRWRMEIARGRRNRCGPSFLRWLDRRSNWAAGLGVRRLDGTDTRTISLSKTQGCDLS
jgi:hypothetical protein